MGLFRQLALGLVICVFQTQCSQAARPSAAHIGRASAPTTTEQSQAADALDSSLPVPEADQSQSGEKAEPSPTQAPPVVSGPPVPATGTVAISVNIIPPTPAGPYRNRGHIRSIWITDASDTYIKTVHAFAGQRSVHLKRWNVFTSNQADGVTGATQITPAAGIPIAASWDLKNKAGAVMSTGNYKLWLEFTESNTPQLDQGKKPSDALQVIDSVNGYESMAIPFTVLPQGSNKADSSNAVFKDVVIKHLP